MRRRGVYRAIGRSLPMLSETRDTLVSAASLDRSSWNPAFLHGLPLVANLQEIPINAMRIAELLLIV